jgi:hypothetical protein
MPAIGAIMLDMLAGIQNVIFWVEIGAIVAVVMIGILALGKFMDSAKKVAEPAIKFAQWMVGHKPGQQMDEVLAGFIYGFRILLWIALIVVVLMIARGLLL